MRYSLFVFLCLLQISHLSEAQRAKQKSPAKTEHSVPSKSLDHSVYAFWEEIPEQALSGDGKYTAFVVGPQEGDGTLYIYTKGQKEPLQKISRGSAVKFSYDSRYAVFKIKPQHSLVKEARRAKKKKDELPKDSLGILALNTGELLKYPSVISFQLPEKGADWAAYLSEKKAVTEAAGESKPKGKIRKENDENGYTLVVRNLSNGTETSFPFVKEYTFSKTGNRISFTSTGDNAEFTPGVYVLEKNGTSPTRIYSGHSKHSFRKPVFSESGDQLAFVADLDTNSKTQIRRPKLFLWKSGESAASIRADENNQPGPAGWLVNAEYTPQFSKNEQTLYYGISPVPAVPDTTLLPEEIVNVEVWHWKDSRLQTQQKATLKTDQKKSYLTALNLVDGRSTLLQNREHESISLIAEGNAPYVLSSDASLYSHEHWDWNPKADIYLINKTTGTRKLVKNKVEGRASSSPDGKFLYWFSNPDTAWVAYSVDSDKLILLTDNKLVRYADETDDHPDYPRSYGIAGWTTGDSQLLVYDRYDIWVVDPLDPSKKTRLTKGREQKLRYRYVKVNPEDRHIDLSKPILLRSFDETSKKEGFFAFTHANGSFEKKFENDVRIGANVLKARLTDDLIFTQETFRNFPNWYQTDLSFRKIEQITQANPWQSEYKWGSVELVHWRAGDGTTLSGLLYKPDGFDPSKKYPMMTYFYEKNSDNLHAHFAPKPIRSYINFSYFTSNDYLVFVPDIVYQIGNPGESAYNCIIPGVLSMIDKGFVDEKRIGISGHSWGGYQTAYLITRTNLFRAAEAGAPVSNMTSAYGGIRWDTGLARQAQYEKTQSRIGGTLWEKPLRYLENSPLFYADKVETPVLMMHNDEDGAVPWYQGIEYFLALKRLGKPVWMLNYNGEKHGLTKRQNMTDFAIRLYQFFDHYLKDAPMPKWMESGLPYVEKGINQGLEPAAEKLADETNQK